jgi:hypothetical protein
VSLTPPKNLSAVSLTTVNSLSCDHGHKEKRGTDAVPSERGHVTLPSTQSWLCQPSNHSGPSVLCRQFPTLPLRPTHLHQSRLWCGGGGRAYSYLHRTQTHTDTSSVQLLVVCGCNQLVVLLEQTEKKTEDYEEKA